ncbi:MAG: Mu-like prophage major head subunit gpT family protein [Candidatus Moraniibacteriota bacterium]
MSFNSALNPNVVKTALDDVFYQETDAKKQPHLATAETGAVFNQDTADSSAVIMELFGGSGAWEQTAEEENLPEGQPRITNQKTFSVVKFAKKIDIPKEFFDDNKHGSYEKMVKNFARRARTTRDKNAFAIFRNAFTTALTADSVALISDSHLSISGNTVDNKLTAALSESSLNDAIVMLGEQLAQDAEIDGHMPAVLVVPMKLYKTATEICESELRSGTADNDLNVYSAKYGITIYTSPYLGAAAGGSDTAWFLLSDNHSVTRWVRESMNTNLVDFQFSDNDVYKYKGRFREVVGAMSYEGIVGSDGSVS